MSYTKRDHAKRSKRMKAKWKEPGYREKMLRTRAEVQSRPETRARQSAGGKRAWEPKARHVKSRRTSKTLWKKKKYREKVFAGLAEKWKDPEFRAKQALGAKRACRKRAKFGEIGYSYPKEKFTFRAMHDRVRRGKVQSIEWPRTIDGFCSFLAEVGPIPKNLKRPSIGRKRHSLGYCAGNIRWEEQSINSAKHKGSWCEHETGDVITKRQQKRALSGAKK